MRQIYGGIDAGGTTFKCGLQNARGEWVAKQRVPVKGPAETLAECLAFFRRELSGSPLTGFGIASFGPIDVDKDSPCYGTILKTPKPDWSDTNLRQYFNEGLSVVSVVDTDVNGALLAEITSGVADGARSAAYITVGTGIGAGVAIDGQILGRPYHPEFGHIPIRRHADDLDFEGVCLFHGDCLEGLASVTALRARWGDPVDWDEGHLGWDIAANYLAQACLTLHLTLRLDRIVLGGGLMLSPFILPKIRQSFSVLMNGYLGDPSSDPLRLIQVPGHGDDAGLEGAILLGKSIKGFDQDPL